MAGATSRRAWPGTPAPAPPRRRRRRRGRGPLGAVAANHALLTAGGLWPRSRWLGSNWTRLPAAAAARREIAITIDDGPDPEVTPAVLDLLDAHGAQRDLLLHRRRRRAPTRPCAARSSRRGHSVQNHSDRHSHRFSLLGPRGDGARDRRGAGDARRHHRRGAALLPRARPGCAIRSWRRCCNASTCSSSAGRGAASTPCGASPTDVLARLARGLAAGDILLAARRQRARAPTAGRAVVLAVLPALLARATSLGLVAGDARRSVAATRAATTPRRRPSRSERIAMSSADAAVEFRALVDGGERAVSARRPVRLALRARQAALGSGLPPPPRARPDRAANARPRHRLRPGPARQPARARRRRPRAQGRWPSDWAEAPVDVRVSGIELLRARRRARPARARRRHRHSSAPTCERRAFAAVDAVVILDVLHYVGIADQDAVLARVRAALPIGGTAAAARRRRRRAAPLRRERSGSTASSSWRAARASAARPAGRSRRGRPASPSLGFAVTSEPMHRGTPFANVLLVATVERAPTRTEREPHDAGPPRPRRHRGADPASRPDVPARSHDVVGRRRGSSASPSTIATRAIRCAARAACWRARRSSTRRRRWPCTARCCAAAAGDRAAPGLPGQRARRPPRLPAPRRPAARRSRRARRRRRAPGRRRGAPPLRVRPSPRRPRARLGARRRRPRRRRLAPARDDVARSRPRRRALVTGASGGIGQAIAERLGRDGAHVIAHANANRAGADAVVAAHRRRRRQRRSDRLRRHRSATPRAAPASACSRAARSRSSSTTPASTTTPSSRACAPSSGTASSTSR